MGKIGEHGIFGETGVNIASQFSPLGGEK